MNAVERLMNLARIWKEQGGCVCDICKAKEKACELALRAEVERVCAVVARIKLAFTDIAAHAHDAEDGKHIRIGVPDWTEMQAALAALERSKP